MQPVFSVPVLFAVHFIKKKKTPAISRKYGNFTAQILWSFNVISRFLKAFVNLIFQVPPGKGIN